MVVAVVAGEAVAVVFQPNTESNINIAKLLMFNRKANKILGFLMAYRLFIRMKMRNKLVKEQI